jgi:serine/threonine-protein kinase HipA
MGRLLFKNRTIFFEYDGAFIKKGLELSPFTLPLQSGVIPCNDPTFEGLFGVFNDSLPDGWGRLLLDRKLMNAGRNPETLSPLDRLCFVGSSGMGALSYEPEHLLKAQNLSHNLDDIDSEIQATLNEEDLYVEDLLTLGGSSAGARPKVLLPIDEDDWLIKFRSHLDPQDMGAIEYAYHLMAKEAGLIVPEAKLFPSRKGLGFFGVKRFDRQNDQRIHMHSMAGLLHADHRVPSLDYEDLMKVTVHLTKDIRQCDIQFRHAAFNAFSHNRDDHSKNFSFLMDARGKWTVSPSYDLTFSSGPAGEHATMIMGEGQNPTKDHLLKLAHVCNMKQNKALEIIHQVVNATEKWDIFAKEVGVSTIQTKNIGASLRHVRKNAYL